jgi:acyl-coenzyme A thioesterase PaaI-like protein
VSQRSGPFWDGIAGRAPVPRAAATLGFEFLAAMLYDTVGPALLATLEPDEFQSTLEFKTSFLIPVRPGWLTGRGRVVHRVGDIAFLEASLTDLDGRTVATATATARVIALADAVAAV